MKKIKLECFTADAAIHKFFPISPAKKFIPEWFKNIPPAVEQTATIKHCEGFNNLYSRGWVIPMWSDLLIETDKEGWYRYQYSGTFDSFPGSDRGAEPIDYHNSTQLGNKFPDHLHLKLLSPWIIKEKTGVEINSICCDYFMKNSLSKNSRSYNEKNLEILNFLIEESCPLNNIKIIDLPLVGEESLKEKKISDDYKNIILKLEKKIIKNNLMIALETDLNPNELKDFLKNFSKNAVTLNYDMGNSAFWEFEAKQ